MQVKDKVDITLTQNDVRDIINDYFEREKKVKITHLYFDIGNDSNDHEYGGHPITILKGVSGEGTRIK